MTNLPDPLIGDSASGALACLACGCHFAAEEGILLCGRCYDHLVTKGRVPEAIELSRYHELGNLLLSCGSELGARARKLHGDGDRASAALMFQYACDYNLAASCLR